MSIPPHPLVGKDTPNTERNDRRVYVTCSVIIILMVPQSLDKRPYLYAAALDGKYTVTFRNTTVEIKQ